MSLPGHRQVFGDRSVKRVILVEDDLEVAVDFFDYFNAVAPIVDSDTTVLAASAWNDLGRPEYVRDSSTYSITPAAPRHGKRTQSLP